MITFKETDFAYRIELIQTPRGKWRYVVHLTQVSSQPSIQFPTSEDALADAEKLVRLMH